MIGVPDDHLGEEVAAVAALRADSSVTADELRQYVKERVAAYKYPRHVEILPELPKTASGKILRRELRSRSQDSH